MGESMKARVLAAGAACLFLSGCNPILQDIRHPGGYPGYLLDKNGFDSSGSKQLQLLRAQIVLSMAARMATMTVQDGGDANAFAQYLGAAVDEINYSAADVYPATMPEAPAGSTASAITTGASTAAKLPCSVAPTDEPSTECAGYYANFESNTPLYEARIVRLMVAALPETQARSFLKDAAHGNVLGSAWKAIRAVYATAGGLHRAAGTYRSGLEIVAAQLGTKCKPGKSYVEKESTVLDAVRCIGLSEDKLFGSPDRVQGANVVVKENAFRALMLIARTSCAQLRLDGASSALQTEKEARNALCEKIRFTPKSRPVSKV